MRVPTKRFSQDQKIGLFDIFLLKCAVDYMMFQSFQQLKRSSRNKKTIFSELETFIVLFCWVDMFRVDGHFFRTSICKFNNERENYLKT